MPNDKNDKKDFDWGGFWANKELQSGIAALTGLGLSRAAGLDWLPSLGIGLGTGGVWYGGRSLYDYYQDRAEKEKKKQGGAAERVVTLTPEQHSEQLEQTSPGASEAILRRHAEHLTKPVGLGIPQTTDDYKHYIAAKNHEDQPTLERAKLQSLYYDAQRSGYTGSFDAFLEDYNTATTELEQEKYLVDESNRVREQHAQANDVPRGVRKYVPIKQQVYADPTGRLEYEYENMFGDDAVRVDTTPTRPFQFSPIRLQNSAVPAQPVIPRSGNAIDAAAAVQARNRDARIKRLVREGWSPWAAKIAVFSTPYLNK